MKTFRIVTLGCKVNRYETAAIEEQLGRSGWRAARGTETADVCIVNTCTVTAKASVQSRQAIRRIVRENPTARIMVTGCDAQIEPEVLARMTGVHQVVGNDHKHRLADTILTSTLNASSTDGEPLTIPPPAPRFRKGFVHMPVARFGNRSRPFLKIQDGCNAGCAYCIVPRARGASRSLPSAQVLDAIAAYAENGYHEVVLTGIHLGAYGRDLSPPESLSGLLADIEERTTRVRIRLSSIEPMETEDAIIERVAGSDRFCRHFHIPIQSGDNRILASMGRPYRIDDIEDRLTLIRARVSDAAVGSDILVGFPGEDDRAFENTVSLVRRLPLTYLHVFPFSPRAGTPAARMADPVPTDVIKQRCRRLRQLAFRKKHRFFESCIGRRFNALIESRRDRKTGRLKGMTDNYLPVLIDGDENLMGRQVEVIIDSVDPLLRVNARVSGHHI